MTKSRKKTFRLFHWVFTLTFTVMTTYLIFIATLTTLTQGVRLSTLAYLFFCFNAVQTLIRLWLKHPTLLLSLDTHFLLCGCFVISKAFYPIFSAPFQYTVLRILLTLTIGLLLLFFAEKGVMKYYLSWIGPIPGFTHWTDSSNFN